MPERACGFESHSGHSIAFPLTIVEVMSTVALFPGQGALSASHVDEIRTLPTWKDTASEIDDVTGGSLTAYLTDPDPARLVDTDRAQLVTFAISVATWRAARNAGITATHMVGHSLGEFSALTAAGVLTLSDGATLVHRRGIAMRRACLHTEGAMAALMGPEENRDHRLEQTDGVWIANVNGPTQVVISGYRSPIADICHEPRAWGWKRATPLTVDGAFHSPLMASAQDDLNDALATISFHDSPVTVLANVTGEVAIGDEWRDRLSRQLQSAVQFEKCVLALPETVTTAYEMGPGSTLVGLAKRIRFFDTLSQWEGR